jgi:hypothetical protein
MGYPEKSLEWSAVTPGKLFLIASCDIRNDRILVPLRQLAGDSSNFFQIFCKIRFSVRVEKKKHIFPRVINELAGKQRWQSMNKGHEQILKDAGFAHLASRLGVGGCAPEFKLGFHNRGSSSLV